MFLLLKGELENRFDATAYKKAFVFKSNTFPIKKLSELAFINPNTSFDKLDKDSYISFVPMEVIDEKSGTITEYQTKKVSESKGFTKFKDNDLIWAKITPCMQNGKSAIVRSPLQGYACGSTEFFIIRPKTSSILIEYIHFLLRDKRVLENAQNYFGGSAGQQRVSKEFIENFKTPLPPIEIQKEIIYVVEKAYALKKANEEKAKALLASIDDYLLVELGITLPEKAENALKNRVFLTNINEVFGKRIDPNKYNPSTVRLAESIEKSPLPKLKLRELVIQSLAGDWGLDESDELDPNNYIKCLVIRATEFDNIYNLRLDNSRVKFRMINRAKFEKLNIQANDLLIEKSGGSEDQPVGRVAIIERSILENQQISFSNFIHKIRVDDTIVYPEYLFYYLKMIHNIKITESMQSQTNGIRNLIMGEYLNQTIVLPELQLQIDIANQIQEIKEQAKTLQSEAKTAIEEAKSTVEAMILGE